MPDMHTSLVQAEIRRALAKAVWYSKRGQSQQALAYWGYAKRLEGYTPELADRIAHETLDEFTGRNCGYE